VEVEEGQVKDARVIPNVPHQQGGCMAPVQHLANHGVKVLVAGGMGLRPLMGFNQVGIEVYYGGQSSTVSQAVAALLEGQLPRFEQQHTCGGGGHAA
jgi:predicted Fe-Mo cluster-binding NifX family protein